MGPWVIMTIKPTTSRWVLTTATRAASLAVPAPAATLVATLAEMPGAAPTAVAVVMVAAVATRPDANAR